MRTHWRIKIDKPHVRSAKNRLFYTRIKKATVTTSNRNLQHQSRKQPETTNTYQSQIYSKLLFQDHRHKYLSITFQMKIKHNSSRYLPKPGTKSGTFVNPENVADLHILSSRKGPLICMQYHIDHKGPQFYVLPDRRHI